MGQRPLAATNVFQQEAAGAAGNLHQLERFAHRVAGPPAGPGNASAFRKGLGSKAAGSQPQEHHPRAKYGTATNFLLSLRQVSSAAAMVVIVWPQEPGQKRSTYGLYLMAKDWGRTQRISGRVQAGPIAAGAQRVHLHLGNVETGGCFTTGLSATIQRGMDRHLKETGVVESEARISVARSQKVVVRSRGQDVHTATPRGPPSAHPLPRRRRRKTGGGYPRPRWTPPNQPPGSHRSLPPTGQQQTLFSSFISAKQTLQI